MSQKQAKKLRQMFNRETRDAVRKAAEMQTNYFKMILKPRPKWFPKWLWKKCVQMFLRVK